MTTAIGSYATPRALRARLGLPDALDDGALALVCDQVNGYIEHFCGRAVCPVPEQAWLYDGTGTPELVVNNGIRSVAKLELAYYTGGQYHTLLASDYFVRPAAGNRRPGWPGTLLVITNIPKSGFAVFPVGYDTVRLTATTGWDAIPDEVTDVALTAATRAWRSAQSGQADVVGVDENGQAMVSRFFSARDLGTLRAYSLDLP